jgi:hypothetical protein
MIRKERFVIWYKEFFHRRFMRTGADKEDNLDPSLAVETPLAQDDSLRRDDFASRGAFSREWTRKNANLLFRSCG